MENICARWKLRNQEPYRSANVVRIMTLYSVYNFIHRLFDSGGWIPSLPSFLPSFSLPDVLCYPTDLIRRKKTPFEAITGRTAPLSDGFLAEVFWDFLQL